MKAPKIITALFVIIGFFGMITFASIPFNMECDNAQLLLCLMMVIASMIILAAGCQSWENHIKDSWNNTKRS